MFPYAALLLSVLLFSIRAATQPQAITFDCNDTPNACENFCYVTNCGGLANSYTNIAPDASPDTNRRASGVKRSGNQPAPCRDPSISWANDTLAEYGPTLDTDEWPPASSTQGGTGASLRCMPSGDNQRAGTKLRNVPRGANFLIVLTTTDFPGSTFCKSQCQTGPCGLHHQFQWDQSTDTYSGPSTLADTTTVNSKLMRRATRAAANTTVPARFVTSRGAEITVLGYGVEIGEGSVVDVGEGGEAVVVRRVG